MNEKGEREDRYDLGVGCFLALMGINAPGAKHLFNITDIMISTVLYYY